MKLNASNALFDAEERAFYFDILVNLEIVRNHEIDKHRVSMRRRCVGMVEGDQRSDLVPVEMTQYIYFIS